MQLALLDAEDPSPANEMELQVKRGVLYLFAGHLEGMQLD